MERVADFTSTGSKRPGALFGAQAESAPLRMVRSSGCVVWDREGREYLDYIMGLGAVALGYGHAEVTRAVTEAARLGVVGPLPPVLEEELAADLCRLIPWLERVRFLKTGAEAMAAAVRLARLFTGRDAILGCGYHGWLDWCQTGEGRGIPAVTRALYRELPFNDPQGTRDLIRAAGPGLAAVVFEPVVLEPPDPEWLAVLREETLKSGALLVADEIKTVCRLAIGGACERYGIRPDLVVVGKAMANGLPLAAVGGRADVMDAVSHTWISSTLATEFLSLAASQATLDTMVQARVPAHLTRVGTRLLAGLRSLAAAHGEIVVRAVGLPEMCFLEYGADAVSGQVAVACAERGLLFKRSAYNFVSLAHDEVTVDRTLGILDDALAAVARSARSS
jgi:glutamate-1-semialdehyde 2,1-aminomutase